MMAVWQPSIMIRGKHLWWWQSQVTTATSTILLFWTADVYHKTVSWFQKACILQGHLHAYSRPVTYEYDYEKLATRCYDLWLVRWLMLMKDRLPGQWEDKDKVEQFLGNNWNQLWSVAYWKKSLKFFELKTSTLESLWTAYHPVGVGEGFFKVTNGCALPAERGAF